MTRVKVSHIEVVQSIQNAVNEKYIEPASCMETGTTQGVPLITRKTTYARVYFEDFDPQDRIKAEGTLEVEYTVGNSQRTKLVTCEGVVSRYQDTSPSLIDQRLNWSFSLNFKLPRNVTIKAEEKKITLVSLRDTITDQNITIDGLADSTNHVSKVKFVTNNELICRALIFRYRDVKNSAYLEPTREEVNTIRQYVEKSFPVAQVEWSVIRVEAHRDFFALDTATEYAREHDETATRMLANMLHQIMAHRNQELKDGFSRKTCYIGVFSDPRGRFGSVAVDAPPFPLPHVVAACATDSTGEDGAHEIAHLLGRSHPGVPLLEIHGRDIGQYRIDKFALTHMGKDGFLSPPDKTSDEEIYVGLDIDNSNGSPTVLAPTKTFDLMSYRAPKWPSAYTYRELHKRLSCTGADGDYDGDPERRWTVICSFDINEKEGQILSVLPTNYQTPEKPEDFDSLEQFIVKRGVDELGSQLAWLVDHDTMNPKFWNLFQKLFDLFIPKFLLDSFAAHDPTDTQKPPAFSVSNYNSFMANIINTLTDETEMSRGEVLLLLNSNGIATELYEPDIRIFPNYSDDNGAPDCPEEDIEYMWVNGIDVYYRRVGSKDRFPFGLLQATVSGKDDTKEPPVSITLMIDKIVVDKYAQSFSSKSDAKQVADAIFNVTQCKYAGDCGGVTSLPVGNGGDCEDRPSSNSLVYDIRKDGYYLNFHWPMAVLRQQPSAERAATITTTIQCWRSSKCVDSDVVNDKWETVCVTNELRDQVWISPDLFEIEYDSACPVERPSAKKPTRLVEARQRDVLKFRFSITVGFFEFFSDLYTASPELVEPRKEDRFERADSDKLCPDDFQYDDGPLSTIDGYTPA